MKKMRGFVDPYTLGFLLSLIGTIITIENGNKQTDEVIEQSAYINKQAIASTQTEDNKEVID